jgi:putative ABC transport system permease protein
MFWNMLLLALREIRRNLLRSALTTLGIVIGVAAVITMVTLGRGATARVTADISGLGRNMLIVAPGARSRGGPPEAAQPFKQADVDAIRRDIPNVAGVAPYAASRMLSVYANRNWATTVQGTVNTFFKVREWPLAMGRYFDVSEERGGRMVCVLGQTVREKLFGFQDPLGATIRLGKLPCRVVGVLAAKGQSTFGQDQDDFVVIPLRAFQRRISGNRDISLIFVSAAQSNETGKVQSDIQRLFHQRRHIGKLEEDDFRVRDMKEITNVVTNATGVLTALLSAIAAVSLVVGGIGIMNIMLVSVTERTREIGIRLAIGALEREVLQQFLVEAIVLSLFGGVIGISLGILCSAIGAHFLKLPLILDPAIMGIAFVFSGAFGVVFGYAPARKAARLDPIDALRHE